MSGMSVMVDCPRCWLTDHSGHSTMRVMIDGGLVGGACSDCNVEWSPTDPVVELARLRAAIQTWRMQPAHQRMYGVVLLEAIGETEVSDS